MHISIGLHEWWILGFNMLIIVLMIFTYFRRRKMGTVLLKLWPTKISYIIISVIAFLLSISDVVYYLFLQNKDLSTLIDKSQSLFFCILMFDFFISPDRITEKGIALSNTLFEWQNIESWSWIDNSLQVLTIGVLEERKRKKVKGKSNVEWKVRPNQKESVDRVIKQYIPEKNRNR